jgi:hypothetical protein
MLKQDIYNSEISSNNCCKDEHKQIKAENDQKITSSVLGVRKISYPESVLIPLPLDVLYVSSSEADLPAVNSPPRFNKVPIILLNCNFRI